MDSLSQNTGKKPNNSNKQAVEKNGDEKKPPKYMKRDPSEVSIKIQHSLNI